MDFTQNVTKVEPKSGAMRHRSWENRSEEELKMDLDAYMQRHPCILDQALGVLKRNPWIFQVCVLSLTSIAAVINLSFALDSITAPWVLFWSIMLMCNYLVYGILCLHSPRTAHKGDVEASGHNYCTPCAHWYLSSVFVCCNGFSKGSLHVQVTVGPAVDVCW